MDSNNIDPAKQDELMKAIVDQAQQINGESNDNVDIGEAPASAPPTAKDVSVSKNIINISFIVFGLAGIAGSFNILNFDMDKYVKFLNGFSWIWAPLVIAVGAGRSLKHYSNKKFGNSSTPPAA